MAIGECTRECWLFSVASPVRPVGAAVRGRLALFCKLAQVLVMLCASSHMRSPPALVRALSLCTHRAPRWPANGSCTIVACACCMPSMACGKVV
eukprot:scaffold11310_cov107-Isochrysis_galbana.AAC.9